MEPKPRLILDVRKSSLEADRRVPGNRDEFPFSLQVVSTDLFLALLLRSPQKVQLVRKTYRHNVRVIGNCWTSRSVSCEY